MSCLSRPDWPQYFQCVREELAEPIYLWSEPVYVWLPWGVWLLLFGVIAFGLGMLLMYVAVRIFGEGILKPFDVIGEWGREGWYFLYRLYRRRQFERFRREAAAEPAGETPADPGREETIDSAAADKAPAGRRPAGD